MPWYKLDGWLGSARQVFASPLLLFVCVCVCVCVRACVCVCSVPHQPAPVLKARLELTEFLATGATVIISPTPSVRPVLLAIRRRSRTNAPSLPSPKQRQTANKTRQKPNGIAWSYVLSMVDLKILHILYVVHMQTEIISVNTKLQGQNPWLASAMFCTGQITGNAFLVKSIKNREKLSLVFGHF